MKVYAISDLHVDYAENMAFLKSLSRQDYRDDILILAGDVSDLYPQLIQTFQILKECFKEVFFVVGNHDLWTFRSKDKDSFEKYKNIRKLAVENGVNIASKTINNIAIVPLMAWYDYSFGQPVPGLKRAWNDFYRTEWGDGVVEADITDYFLNENEIFRRGTQKMVISFSHFLPRIDLMPSYIPAAKRVLYPIYGSSKLDKIVDKTGSDIHVFGHTHVNIKKKINGRVYINNAYGYPQETWIAKKKLITVY